MALAEEKQKYWDVVVDCLVELFGQQVDEARDKATCLQSKIEHRRGGLAFELFDRISQIFYSRFLAQSYLFNLLSTCDIV